MLSSSMCDKAGDIPCRPRVGRFDSPGLFKTFQLSSWLSDSGKAQVNMYIQTDHLRGHGKLNSFKEKILLEQLYLTSLKDKE